MSVVCHLACAFHATGNSPPDVWRGDTGQQVYTVQVCWFEAARDDSAAVVGPGSDNRPIHTAVHIIQFVGPTRQLLRERTMERYENCCDEGGDRGRTGIIIFDLRNVVF